MNVYECALVIADGIAETQAVGAAIELQVERVIGTQTVGGSGITDGDKGDITVSGSGTTWTIDAETVGTTKLADRSITAAKLFQVGHEKLIGRHAAGVGDAQEIGIDGGLELQGGNLRRSALTGDVTASAGGNSTTIATGAVTTAKMGGDVTAAGKALLDDADAAAQRATLGLGTAATAATGDFAAASHTHTLSNLTQSGATTNQIAQWNGTAWVPVTFTSGIGGTLGSTDNALTRADGTGGVTAQGSAVIIDDSGNATGLGSVTCTAFAISQSTYSGRTLNRILSDGTNESVVIGPSGTGYLSLLTPDGTTAGGNQRGDRAVDFNVSVSNAANIASGANSFACGADARASGSGSFAFGNSGASTIASGVSAIAMGIGASASAQASVAIGGYPTASGFGAAALGYSVTASGASSSALGDRSNAYLSGQLACASGRFASNGDAQFSFLTARGSTAANSTPVNLFLDNVSSRIVIPANTSWAVDITIVARTTTAGAAYAVFRRQCLVWRGVAVGTTVCSTAVTIGTDQGSNAGTPPAGWAVAITADTTNGALDIQCTGSAAAGAARWVAQISLTEVTNA